MSIVESATTRADAPFVEKTPEMIAATLRGDTPSLVGLTRGQLKDALAAIGVPVRELKMRVAQL